MRYHTVCYYEKPLNLNQVYQLSRKFNLTSKLEERTVSPGHFLSRTLPPGQLPPGQLPSGQFSLRFRAGHFPLHLKSQCTITFAQDIHMNPRNEGIIKCIFYFVL